MDYLVIIEETNTGFSAYAPDLPGCIATGKTFDLTRKRMREAIEFHIEGLRLEEFRCRSPRLRPCSSTSVHRGRWPGSVASRPSTI